MLPVDCTEAVRTGVVEFCNQQLDTMVTHVACHRSDQVSTAALACLPDLRSLTLAGTKVKRLDPLRELRYLRRLNLSHTFVVSLHALADVPSLRELALDETRVVNLAPLARLPSLSKLRLQNTRDVDWSTLAGFPSLVELDVSANEEPDLTALGPHRGLRAVRVPDSILDLSRLADMPQLRKLVIDHERSSSVPMSRRREVFEGLAAVTQLREIELYRSEVKSLLPLAGMSMLEELWLDAPKMSSLAPLTKLTNLTFIGFAGTEGLGERREAELASLASLPNLTTLTVYESPPDTSYLRGFPHLRAVLISAPGSEALDIGGVATLTKLETFEVRRSKVTRLLPLARLQSLTELTLNGTEVPRAEVDAIRRARPGVAVTYRPEPEDDWDDWDFSDDPVDW